ncbi:RHS repeat domain-containing protein [Chryseobacterium hagamense]|uniref:RHS repeat domain-containing protein n=1 Tax=Chryseobacterium hagamense TaxID=395935 RepID=UPI001E2EE20B|nr:RHS repeat-associated core domain-containing protein [Chryseobacterium hagamense]
METLIEQQVAGKYSNPYKFNAKELDSETGLYYYGARYYNPRLSVWYGVDPLAEKMPGWSPYVYAFDNPVRYTDPDGRAPNDIVYFNMLGQEIYRIKSNTEFRTFVQASTFSEIVGGQTSIAPVGSGISGFFVEAQMPNIIQTRTQSGEDVSGPKYQVNDYQIAASTHLSNNELNSGTMIVGDKNGNLVKAWSMQESHAGTNGSIYKLIIMRILHRIKQQLELQKEQHSQQIKKLIYLLDMQSVRDSLPVQIIQKMVVVK